MSLGLFKEALIDCHNSLARQPEYFKAYLRRARVNKALGDYPSSIRDYRKYIWSTSPTHPEYRDAQRELDEVLLLLHVSETASSRARAQSGRFSRGGRGRGWADYSDYAEFNSDFDAGRQPRQNKKFYSNGNTNQSKPNSEPKKSNMSPCEHGKKEQTHYDVLGVPSSAIERDIKLAYRKLALKYHPDKCKDPSGEEIFKKITGAYSTIIDKVILPLSSTLTNISSNFSMMSQFTRREYDLSLRNK